MYPNLNCGALGINATLFEAADLAAEHGFAGIDFSIVEAREQVEASSLDGVKERLDGKGIQLGAWGLPVNWRGDEQDFDEDLASLPELAELAAGLGCLRALTVVVPGHDERDFETNWKLHLARLRPIAQILDAHGCRLGLEFVGPRTLRSSFEHEFVYTMEKTLELGAAVGENVGLLLDLFHLYTSYGDIADVRVLHPHQVVAVHINDGVAGRTVDEQMDLERTLPGETGVTDIAGFLDALSTIGYAGPVTVEPFSVRLKGLPENERVAETMKSIRRSWEQANLSLSAKNQS